jgi:hypothetical protein
LFDAFLIASFSAALQRLLRVAEKRSGFGSEAVAQCTAPASS